MRVGAMPADSSALPRLPWRQGKPMPVDAVDLAGRREARWSPKSRRSPASWLRSSLGALLLGLVATAGWSQEAQPIAQPRSITVVLDDNYPPFVFRDSAGELKGVLADTWALWQQRTGIVVNLQAMDWAKAQQVMQDGQADVIDTIFETEDRRRLYDFTAPYAKLSVPIFFHQSITGIVNAESLRGFTVGVKDGDACIDVLRRHGVESLRKYPSYSTVIAAAMAGDVRVFCMDEPPALYLLHQHGAEREFRRSTPLYAGEFHRAVRKGNTAMLQLLAGGFGRITEAERKAIDEKWYGSALDGRERPPYARYGGYALLGALLLAAFLTAWSLMLRRRVAARTAELSASLTALSAAKQLTDQALARLDATLQAVPDLLFELDFEGRYLDYRAARTELLAAPPDELLGRTVRDVMPKEAADIVMDALRAASSTGSSHGAQLRLALPQGERWFELSIARKRGSATDGERFIVMSRDITDRKHVELELQRSERSFRNFFDAGLVGMAICTPDQHWGRCNARLAAMLGYTVQEMESLTWSGMTHADDLAADEDNLDPMLAGSADGYAMDKRFIRQDGSVLHASIAVRCDRDANGTPVRLFKTVADIGARVQAQSALRSNEQRLQALLDNISCGVIVHAPDTHIIDANPGACRVVGLTLEQLRGKAAIDPYWYFLEEDGSAMPPARFPVHQVLTSGRAINKLVLGVRRPDLANPVWVQVDAYAVRDDHGQVSQVVVTFADITDLKQAEDRTRRLNRSLRVLSSCNLGLVEVRDEATYLAQVCEAVAAAGGYRLACVVFANQDPTKSARIVASAGPETGYLDKIQLSWDADVPAGLGPFGTAVRTGRAQVNQDWKANAAMAPWRDAALRHGFQSSIGLPLTASGQVIGILSLYASEIDAFNAEELPPLEELARILSAAIDTLRTRRQRDLAEGANRAKSEFLANMSHEIRTPLNAIVGLNYLMRHEGVTPPQAARLDKVDGASRHLLSLINDILDLAKIEAGQVQLESANFHLSTVLDSVASIIAESARAKGLTIEVDADAVPLWLRGDPTRLRQVLLNFAGNAVKFTETGSVALRAKLLEDRGHDVLVRFEVVDTGVGIAPESLPLLFRAFGQADASITRKFGGTGLGLAITKRLAEMMGGECGVQSQPGVGSTFWFTAHLMRGHGALPASGAESQIDVEALLRRRHQGARTLVAEDNRVNQEVLLALLHGVGLNADVASDGREAVALANSADYSMALMDMQMPLMGGLEATREIRKLAHWRNRPIIAFTANAFDEDRQACTASGMDDFITKPVEPKVLYAMLLKWLDSGRCNSENDSTGAIPQDDGRN
jgi:PAS domain S-box-containing protein